MPEGLFPVKTRPLAEITSYYPSISQKKREKLENYVNYQVGDPEIFL